MNLLFILRANQKARKIVGNENFNKHAVSLYADPANKHKYDYLIAGFKLFIINYTDSTINLGSFKLQIVCEAKMPNGKWKEIETNPTSWCGNSDSFSEVILDTHSYYTLPVACYTGSITTMLRYKMKVRGDLYIYSNEILGEINSGQLE